MHGLDNSKEGSGGFSDVQLHVMSHGGHESLKISRTPILD
jgi:hypothetical protein